MYSDRVSFRSKHIETKAFETTDAINNGADEVDMVINIGALKSKMIKKFKDIEAVVEAAKDRALVKVIIETSLLDRRNHPSMRISKSCRR